jgi:predicted MFS family arabinose efflux permease
MSSDIKRYGLVTACYWAFTLSDGALRMLVVLYFHQLGYSPLEVATLFLLYEFFGIVTNLFGGWLAARWGLTLTMRMGLALQVVALSMLLLPESLLSVSYVMVAQAVSGIAKDLNKMSAKSAIKLLVPEDAQGQLYRWVSFLTGSKNTLKGLGFFMGGALLSLWGFQGAVGSMAIALLVVLLLSLVMLRGELGTTSYKPKFSHLVSKSAAVNRLSAARLFLFGARDIWFVVALPVYLQTVLEWNHVQVGSFLAAWIVAYGLVQTSAPAITGLRSGHAPDGGLALKWALLLSLLPALIALALYKGFDPSLTILVGLMVFGVVFAVNSSIHSYLIVSYAKEQGVSLDVGFYYMANAAGRLIGTVLSGLIFQYCGLEACLLASSLFLVLTCLISVGLPKKQEGIY